MSIEKCIIEVGEVLKRPLTQEERKQITEAVHDMIETLSKDGNPGELNAKVRAAISSLSEDLKAQALIEKRNTALNVRAKLLMKENFSNVWKDAPKEGLKALLDNSLLDRKGARSGVSAHINSLQRKYTQGVLSRLAEKDLLDMVKSGTRDLELVKAMSELNQVKPNPDVLSKLPKDIVEAAQILNDAQELARVRSNKAGSWIKKYPGYSVKQSHDSLKIRKAAGLKVLDGNPKHFEAWKDFISERLDWDKTMPDVSPERRSDVLLEQFKQFSNGVHVKFGQGGVEGLTGFGNIGKRSSHERVFHFKNPQAEYEYHQKFSSGSSILDTVNSTLTSLGRDTAIMEKFGPNAEANIDSVVKDLEQNYIKDKDLPNGGELAKDIKDDWDRKKNTLWKNITGETSIPMNHTVAAIGQGIRNIVSLGDLGRITINSIPDLSLYASQMHYTGNRTWGNYFSGVGEAVGNLFQGIGKKITPADMKLASEMGVGLDLTMTPLTQSQHEFSVPGRTSEWLRTFFKANLYTWFTDNMKLGAVAMESHRHALDAHLPFNELSEGRQAWFKQFDISEKDWDLIRKMEPGVDAKGRKYLSPEGLNALDKKNFDSIVKGSKTEGARARALRELEDKYRASMSEVAAHATSEPGRIERSFIEQGTQPGTGIGEGLRSLGLFKSFMLTMTRRHLGRQVYGYGESNPSVLRGLINMTTGKDGSSFQGMANMIAYGALLGYASLSLSDISKGKTPRVPEDAASFAKIFGASMTHSGAGGIYGDFLFGEMKSRFGQSPLETFLGPVFRRGSDITDLWGSFKAGDDVAAKSVRILLNNTPGVNAAYNLFYTKLALDYLIIFRMQEMMNPGYLRRMEERLEREQNQSYIVPPSSVIPYGG